MQIATSIGCVVRGSTRLLLFLAALGLLAVPAYAHGGGRSIIKDPPKEDGGGSGNGSGANGGSGGQPSEGCGYPPPPPEIDGDKPDVSGPPTSGPVTAGGSGPVTGGATGRRPRAAATAPAWTTWWALNRWAYLPVQGDRFARAAARLTGPEASADALAADFEARRAALAKSGVIPTLRAALAAGPKTPPRLRAATLITLARIDTHPDTVAALRAHLTDPKQPQRVRESAALAIGHLRRTHADAQLPAVQLDLLRRALLDAFDDATQPTRVRAFAALALGLLADQPYATAFSRDGRLVVRALWERFARSYASDELPVALLTALGMQPPAGIPAGVRDSLQGIALGKRFERKDLSDAVRSHALTTRIRMGGRGWPEMLQRVLSARRMPAPVRQAAYLALAGHAGQLDPDGREEALAAWTTGQKRIRDPLTRGLAQLARARLLAAAFDAASGSAEDTSPKMRAAFAELRSAARNGTVSLRSFSALALGVAARSLQPASADAKAVSAELRTAVGKPRGSADLEAAYVTALGLMADRTSVPLLSALLRDRGKPETLRGHAAIALGQIGDDRQEVVVGLRAALMDRRRPHLRKEAGLALSFLLKGRDTKLLLRELAQARTQAATAQLALALGHMRELRAVPGLLATVGDEKRQDEPRAVALTAVGLILDPEPRPTLSALRIDANYPARTATLHEALSIL